MLQELPEETSLSYSTLNHYPLGGVDVELWIGEVGVIFEVGVEVEVMLEAGNVFRAMM